jgi:LuxR family maltose regulon positive regulatory protein
MDASILSTKLYLPAPPPRAILRPRLIMQLVEGQRRKFTLISAPAGSGKTTLASEWLAASGRPAAWLSLDEADSEPARFLTYLAAAVQTVAPGLGEAALEALQSPQPPIEPVLTALLNDIAALPEPFILVLDDYHVLESQAVDQALVFLLEHLPRQMHLALTTREDPRLPLARLRARDQMTELRAADLRFTPAEAAGFLRGMGLDLATEDVAALEERTEGWIAGLQLAALALRGLAGQGETAPDGEQDAAGFIREFAGDHRYVMDYLLEEVLQRQAGEVRGFLLQTAILERLCGPLCDAVTGRSDGEAQLEALERGNFFVVPLDGQRRWYRYHHLFAGVLRVRLAAEQPGQVAGLHRRASAWYEQHDSAADAVHHALAAQDLERAADLIERAMPDVRRSRQEATLLGWLRALPEALLQRRPVLNIHFAGAMLQSGQLEGVAERLREAERRLDTAPGEEAAVRHLRGWIANYRAGIALASGNLDVCVQSARLASDLVPEEDDLGRGAAAGLLGLACWGRGELEAALRSYAESMARLLRAGHISDAIGLSIAQADILLTQGRLGAALRTYERGWQLATEQGKPVLRGAADMLVGLSDIRRERNDFPAAERFLQKSQEQGALKELSQNQYRWRVAQARIRQAEGDLDAALALLDEAERLYMGDFSPNVRPVAALRARVWAVQGRLVEAFDWARARGLSAEDGLSYLREYEHVTLARLLLAQYQTDRDESALRAATGLLERLLRAADDGGRAGSAIEILVLVALARQARGDVAAALESLRQALALAGPEGYARVFLDEGPGMALLLRVAAGREEQAGVDNYAGRLLAALESEVPPAKSMLVVPETQPAISALAEPEVPPAESVLIEPLSQRELDVLRLFKTELSGPEIARELMVALSTVRTHTKSIYSKLDVNNRRAAVRRAEELKLI